MKLERLHEYLTSAVAILIAVLFAMWCGKLSGQGATALLEKMVGGVAALILGLLLRERIWILIPFLSGFGGSLPFLPLSLGELGIGLAFGWTIVFVALKIIRTKVTYTLVDIFLFVNLVYLATAFIRHPVGVDYFGTDRVGGRGYFTTMIALLGYWVLCRADLSTKDAWRLPLYYTFGAIFTLGCGAVGYFFPSAGTALGAYYTGFMPDDPTAAAAPGGETTSRWAFTAVGSGAIILVLCAYCRPVSLVNPLYFWRFLLTGISFFFLLLAGFRSGAVGAAINVIIAAFFRNGAGAVLKIAMLGACALVLLIAVQGAGIIDLPISAQRALSFLPGKWDYDAKSDAEGSTEWRVMMWKAMLTEDKYLENRWLGDGFGFTRRQLETMQRNTTDVQENFLITGDVHSGPVSAIRFVGYIGLGLFIPLLVLIAIDAAKLMRRSLGTPFFPAAVYIGVPLVFHPISFLFIFGGYQGDLPGAILSIGMLHLIGRGLDLYQPEDSGSHPLSSSEMIDERPALLSR
jgi:hypothetical protein